MTKFGLKRLAAGGLRWANRFPPSRRVLATASRHYRAFLGAYYWGLADGILRFRKRHLPETGNEPGPLSFLGDLRSLSGRPAPEPYSAWEEVNRLHPNKRSLLAGRLQGEEAAAEDGHQISVPAGGGSARLTAVDHFVSLLIDRQVEAVSFDLFDTLVGRRLERPRDLFLVIDRKLAGRWPLPRPYSSYRISAEEAVRKSSPREEVTLAEIYDELARAAGLDEGARTELLNLEIETELKFIRPRPAGVELLNQAREQRRRIYLVSDMYLGREEIERILDSCGMGKFSGIYLSSEEGKTKHSGGLFELFLRREQLAAGRVLHVGDNRHSDRDVPSRLGLETFLVRPPAPPAGGPDGKDGDRLADGIFSALERTVLSETRRVHGEFGPRYGGDPFLLGYCALGPLLLGFTSRICQAVRNGDFPRLYFVSRDAYYFQACYELIRRHDPALPPSTYLYSSRKLIYRASMADGAAIAEAADRDYFPARLRDLLTGRFCFSDGECSALPAGLLEKHGFSSLDDRVEKTANHRQLLGLVLACREEICRQARRYRERYVSYLRETVADGPGLLVDIGYSGTLQRFIRDHAGRELEGLYLIVLDRISALKREGSRFQAYIRPGDPEHPRFFRHVQMFELLLSARHPSVIDVGQDPAGRWAPVYDRHRVPPGSADALERLHRGALQAAEDFLELTRESVTAGTWGAGRAMRRLLDYLDAPDYADCLHWEDLFFEDSFAGRSRQYAFSRGSGPGPVWKEGEAARRTPIEPRLIPSGRAAGEDRPDHLHDPLPLPGNADHLTLWAFFREGEEEELRRLLFSLRHQMYSAWTLIIGLEAGLKTAFDRWREILPPGGGRIRTSFFPPGEESFRRFIEMGVAGERFGWGFFCLPGVKLKPEALAEVAAALKENPDSDGFYCDEIRVPAGGEPRTFFKPDWSPELLLSGPYPGPFWGGRKDFWNFSPGGAPSRRGWLFGQFLRWAEDNRRVFHLPRALYEYSPPDPDPDFTSVIQDSLDRRKIPGQAYNFFSSLGQKGGVYSVEFPDRGPEVAVIIPTRNQSAILKRCLDSLRLTTYQNYRVYIVDNGSDDPETLEFLGTCGHRVFRIESPPGGFNYSYLNNQAAGRVGEDYLLFLNNDTEVINPRWLSQLVGWLQFPGVGAAGGRLVFADGRVQHAGIVNRLLYRILPAPAFKLLAGNDPGYNNLALRPRNCSALTAACLLTPRRLFLENSGFDEKNFGVAYNDCDYGFRLTRSGYRNVYCPEALLYHHEGSSRGTGAGNDNPAEEAACIRRYSSWADPCYNPNLSLENTGFALSSRHPYVYRKKKKLRLLLFSHNYNLEGAPLVLYEVARGLKGRGHFPVVLSPMPGPLNRKYRDLDIPAGVLTGLDSSAAFRPKTYIREMKRITQDIGRLGVDAAAGNTILTWWELAAAGLLEIPYLWIIHESEPPFRHRDLLLYGTLARKQAEAVFYRSYQNVFVADSTRALYRAYSRNHNLAVIHNSFDPGAEGEEWEGTRREQARRQLGLRDDELCVLTPGTICERKSQLDVISMIDRLPERLLANVKFLIVGDRPSPYSDQLHKAVNMLPGRKSEKVEIIPITERISRYYLASDILAFPSRMESFPRVIMEAMQTALAIVTTPVFGIREMVSDEVSALFFPPGEIGAFADRMQRVLESKPLRERLGRNAKISLGKLPTPKEMIDQYEDLFLEAWLSGTPRRIR